MMRSHNRYADPVASLGELCQELDVVSGVYAWGGLLRAALAFLGWVWAMHIVKGCVRAAPLDRSHLRSEKAPSEIRGDSLAAAEYKWCVFQRPSSDSFR
jgi:hypothetical protein